MFIWEQYEYSLDYCFTHTDHVVGVVLQIFMKFEWKQENKTKKEIRAKVTDKQKFGIPSDITHTMVTRLYLKKVCVFKDFSPVVNSMVSDAR